MNRPAARQGFPKSERLRKRSEYLALFNQGKRINGKNFILFLFRHGRGQSRLGITASRKVGKAVTRNRLKRMVREYYRLHKENFPCGYDYSMVVKRDCSRLSWTEITAQLTSLLRKVTDADRKFQLSKGNSH